MMSHRASSADPICIFTSVCPTCAGLKATPLGSYLPQRTGRTGRVKIPITFTPVIRTERQVGGPWRGTGRSLGFSCLLRTARAVREHGGQRSGGAAPAVLDDGHAALLHQPDPLSAAGNRAGAPSATRAVSTFSWALRVEIRLKVWKMNPIEVARTLVTCASRMPVRFLPPKSTVPDVGRSRPPRSCSAGPRIDHRDGA